MRRFFAAFDSFVFKSFDMLGRSSRSEYWCVMPVLWAAMIGLVWWDFRGIFATMDAGEIPSLNPFAYGSVLFVLLTAIPRITLAMRRLQDSGRKGKWATLPYSAGFLGTMGLFGLATSGAFVIESGVGEVPVPMALAFSFGNIDAIMLTIFELIRNIDSVKFVGSIPSAGEFASVGSALGEEAVGTGGKLMMLMVLGLLFLYPPIAILLYVLFMTFASQTDENAYGLPSNFDHGPKSMAKGEHNAFASYAILTRQGHKPTESEIAARKEEVHSLYEQRVLGRQQN